MSRKQMRKNSRKGQASMEVLMTYRWATHVVLVAIGAVAYCGILDPSRLLPSTCTVPHPFTCQESVVSNAGISLVLGNLDSKPIDIVGITADSDAIEENSSYPAGCMLRHNTTNLNVVLPQTYQEGGALDGSPDNIRLELITMNSSHALQDSSAALAGFTVSGCDFDDSAGRAKNRYDFVVQYKYTEGSLTHRADGNFVTNQP